MLLVAVATAACGGAAPPAPSAARTAVTRAESRPVIPTPSPLAAVTAPPDSPPAGGATATSVTPPPPIPRARPADELAGTAVPTTAPAEDARATEPPTAKATPTPRPAATPTPPAPRTATGVPKPRRTIASQTLYASTDGFAGVNLRERPDSSAPLLLTLRHGARVTALGSPVRSPDGRLWYAVRYGERTGYAAAAYLSRRAPRDLVALGNRPLPARKRTAEWSLNAVGDIMLSRNVLEKMQAYDSYRHPYIRTREILADADFTVANLECPLSDIQKPSTEPGTFQFVAPTAAADGIRWAGIDAVSLANNHTLNFGQPPLVHTMEALDRYGIGHFGAGRDQASAYGGSVYRIKGLDVAFLGFDYVWKWSWEDADEPGIATAYASLVREAIVRAKARADVVIPFFHWGDEYEATPNGFQREMARLSIDAGADLVLGAHPHWVQTTERYRGKLIVYSLGNFVFDQMWSRETRRGALAHFTFRGRELTDVRYTPVKIYDYNQPRPASGEDRQLILDRLGE